MICVVIEAKMIALLRAKRFPKAAGKAMIADKIFTFCYRLDCRYRISWLLMLAHMWRFFFFFSSLMMT
jgi:hypothetical protein